jgi:hypothetical protein
MSNNMDITPIKSDEQIVETNVVEETSSKAEFQVSAGRG